MGALPDNNCNNGFIVVADDDVPVVLVPFPRLVALINGGRVDDDDDVVVLLVAGFINDDDDIGVVVAACGTKKYGY